jgi:hypothetical protein
VLICDVLCDEGRLNSFVPVHATSLGDGSDRGGQSVPGVEAQSQGGRLRAHDPGDIA